MYTSYIILCFILFSTSVFAKLLPDFIKPCAVLTPECFKTTIQETIPDFAKGISDLGVNSTDPLYQGRLELTLPGNLKVQFIDGIVTGLRNCVVDSAKFENDVADLNLHCNITIKGKYKAKGRLLIFTLNGDGDAKIKAKNIYLGIKITFNDKSRDGIIYYDVKNYAVKHRFEDKVVFTLTNLFKGNPEISDAVLKFLNDNWKQVVDEFGGPIVDTVVKDAITIVKKFFTVVPKNEIMA